MTRRRLLALLAVMGPGLLAGLSDDDPAGIATYSVLGARQGYRLLWVLVLSTLALVLFHDLGARMGIVTGQGLAGLVREAYGVRLGAVAVTALVLANLGTTCAEFAGVAAGFELFGVRRQISVPLAAAAVSLLVLKGSFHRVERVLLAVSAVFATYVVAGLLAGPDWGRALRGSAIPSLPRTRDSVALATATIGTTLAPWGLAFIQSYAADKRLTLQELKYERADVITGAALTGVIGFFVVVACAVTLNAHGIAVDSAADAARALEPLAGAWAGKLFGLGLIGAALLAASVLPLSTAYSVSEFIGRECALDDQPREAPLFYGVYAAVTVVSAAVVLLPGAPLLQILVVTQILNAVLLLPLLAFMYAIARNPDVMGAHAAGRLGAAGYLVAIGFIAVCVAALAVLSVL